MRSHWQAVGRLHAGTAALRFGTRRRAFNSWLCYAQEFGRAWRRIRSTMSDWSKGGGQRKGWNGWLDYMRHRALLLRIMANKHLGRAFNEWYEHLHEQKMRSMHEEELLTWVLRTLTHQILRRALNSWFRTTIYDKSRSTLSAGRKYVIKLVGPLRSKSRALNYWRDFVTLPERERKAWHLALMRKKRAATRKWSALLNEGGLTGFLRTGKLVLMTELRHLEQVTAYACRRYGEGEKLMVSMHDECNWLKDELSKAQKVRRLDYLRPANPKAKATPAPWGLE